jgi:hypothetical protein
MKKKILLWKLQRRANGEPGSPGGGMSYYFPTGAQGWPCLLGQGWEERQTVPRVGQLLVFTEDCLHTDPQSHTRSTWKRT